MSQRLLFYHTFGVLGNGASVLILKFRAKLVEGSF